MKWYFYDHDGRVTTIFHSEPPAELLTNPYIKSDEVFEQRQGYYQVFSVDVHSGKVLCNYVKIKPSVTEEIENLKTENTNQSELIDVCLLGFDEMYMMLESVLPPEMAATIKAGGAKGMVDVYVAMVVRGLKTIDQVPVRYREQVKEVLASLER